MKGLLRLTGGGIASLAAIFLLVHQKSPVAFHWRAVELPLLLGILGLNYFLLGALFRENRRRWLVVALSVVLAVGLLQEKRFYGPMARVAQAPDERVGRLGRHFVVGFSSWSQVETLALRGAIGGIYLARKNVAGRTLIWVRQRIDRLQAQRRSRGLPLLLVTTDQEGGAVSRLSPPLPRQDALASLVALATQNEAEDGSVANWAGLQARGLAAMGVNVNFSPVADLKPAVPPLIDRGHTQIFRRAIASDPIVVTAIALGVCEAYERHGLLATVKHFPGLGQVSEETHFKTGRLDLAPEILMRRDWIPFQEITRRTNALMMLGHVRLPQIDPDLPASFSRKIVQDIIRGQWRHEGLLVTDDLNMGPAYSHPGGIGAASVKALNAGVDLLLIAYDPDQYFRAMDAFLQADAEGRLDRATLKRSARRLIEAAQWLEKSKSIVDKQSGAAAPEVSNANV